MLSSIREFFERNLAPPEPGRKAHALEFACATLLAEVVRLDGEISLIRRHYSQEQRQQIVELLWCAAYADAASSAHEQHVIRKIADLLYVPHAAYIAAKMRAKETSPSALGEGRGEG